MVASVIEKAQVVTFVREGKGDVPSKARQAVGVAQAATVIISMEAMVSGLGRTREALSCTKDYSSYCI